jgi:hypothetical protein
MDTMDFTPITKLNTMDWNSSKMDAHLKLKHCKNCKELTIKKTKKMIDKNWQSKKKFLHYSYSKLSLVLIFLSKKKSHFFFASSFFLWKIIFPLKHKPWLTMFNSLLSTIQMGGYLIGINLMFKNTQRRIHENHQRSRLQAYFISLKLNIKISLDFVQACFVTCILGLLLVFYNNLMWLLVPLHANLSKNNQTIISYTHNVNE